MTQRATTRNALTQRRVEETRTEIFQAAIDLFIAQGFDGTSMEDVASAAGVSRRTLYRYFGTKDDIVFEPPREWLGVMNEALASREEGETTRAVFRRALLAVAGHVERDAANVLRAYSVLASSPKLASRHGRSDAEWVERYMHLLAPDFAGQEHDLLKAMAAAMALVGAQNALIAAWASQHPKADLIEMTEVVLGQLDSVWVGEAGPPKG
jgi:AcrR family transcriptional regulator